MIVKTKSPLTCSYCLWYFLFLCFDCFTVEGSEISTWKTFFCITEWNILNMKAERCIWGPINYLWWIFSLKIINGLKLAIVFAKNFITVLNTPLQLVAIIIARSSKIKVFAQKTLALISDVSQCLKFGLYKTFIIKFLTLQNLLVPVNLLLNYFSCVNFI